MDFRNIESFIGVDTNEAEELGRLLADTLASDLEKIRCGLRDSDAQSISFVAHSIKGASGNLGFERLSQLAAAMEIRTRGGRLDGLENLILEMQCLLEQLEGSLSGK
ncbi:Hpt domain-containing protein [Desulfobacter hydrogenophilus]|uniref:Hpt domain-containing protein n=1 Tax=Desulfobacter hydrogenophilus TaxID=2291 RepID=A0A328FEJ5_9BACT|nr:Hpt domain-containing protein [Desulfobacter hydrogenophilus]NDY71553.1 Hpt domain-containing protein [Desulfobacter hydrogenophilus]QBH11935.1 Hpt domain-containing protein [Desulfobacter hydrogenophilus]RAM02576.1 Hpt domain-containing protein [Desulfobacter hydrogenophilus]